MRVPFNRFIVTDLLDYLRTGRMLLKPWFAKL